MEQGQKRDFRYIQGDSRKKASLVRQEEKEKGLEKAMTRGKEVYLMAY